MYSPTKGSYIHPSPDTAFDGVTAVAGSEPPGGAWRSAKVLAKHLEMAFFSNDFQGSSQFLFRHFGHRPHPGLSLQEAHV